MPVVPPPPRDTAGRIILPRPDDFHTLEQLLAARPFLTRRGVVHWCEKNQIRFYKRGIGPNAQRLFKLADIDAFIGETVVEPRQAAH